MEPGITEALPPGWWGLPGSPCLLGCCTAALESSVVQAGCQLEVAVSELTEMVGGVESSLFCPSSVALKLVAKC